MPPPRREATRRKLGADVVIMGECEELLPRLAERLERRAIGSPHSADMCKLPGPRTGRARRSPNTTTTTIASKRLQKDPAPRWRPRAGARTTALFARKTISAISSAAARLTVIAEELDGLVANGIEYVYFIDEIFLAYRDVLEVIRDRHIKFGIQTRIDLWSEEMLDLLGDAGLRLDRGRRREHHARRAGACSIRSARSRPTRSAHRLIHAKKRVPFVQANLLDSRDDDPADVEAWRAHLHEHGVWANKPVPLFPYPARPTTRALGRARRSRLGARARFTWAASTSSAIFRNSAGAAWCNSKR